MRREWRRCFAATDSTRRRRSPTRAIRSTTLAPLADAGVPLLHAAGDADPLVPFDENTGRLVQRYRALGGEVDVIVKPGVGHAPGLDDPTPVIEFIAAHAE